MTIRSSRRSLLLMAGWRAIPLVSACCAPGHAEPLASPSPQPYVRRGLLAQLPFGTRSHWIQPWREVTEVRPADTLANAFGAVVDKVTLLAAPAAVGTLARHGLRHLRIEIGWGDLDYATETRFGDDASIRRLLFACRREKVRPLILLNAHHGKPVPNEATEVRLAAPVRAGERSLIVSTATTVIPRHTGITDPVEKVMAGLFVTESVGGRLELSRPFPRSLPAGTTLQLATLRYEPFSEVGSSRNEATIAGWLHYVDIVANLVGTVMEQSNGDRGFDLEIWNELTFGSNFLSIGNYYDPKPADAQAHAEAIWADLPARTAAHVAANPARYAGVALVNGFASTIPWVSADRQPSRIAAISKHPYPPEQHFPQDAQKKIQALGPDAKPTDFEPSYTAFFPEYQATAIQTETLLRDVSPQPNPIYKAMHGQQARVRNGIIEPVEVWLTEIGVSPKEMKVTDRAAADRLKTKFCLRAALFHQYIGVARTYLFNAVGNRAEFALVDATLPGSPTPTLRALARTLELLRGPAEPPGGPKPLMQVSFGVHPSASAARPIFVGDGPGRPPLTGADCLVLLPFRRASGCIAVVYYVMTRDVRIDWPAEQLRVQVEGIRQVAAVHAYDPVANQPAPSTVVRRSGDGMLLELEVTDTPRVLVLECDGASCSSAADCSAG